MNNNFGDKHKVYTPYHPQTNGLQERTNQTIERQGPCSYSSFLLWNFFFPLVIWMNYLDILENITHKFNFSGETANRNLEEVKNDNKTINNQ